MNIIPFNDSTTLLQSPYIVIEQWKRYYLKYITYENQNPLDIIDNSCVIMQDKDTHHFPIAFFYHDSSPRVMNVYLIIHPEYSHSIHDIIKTLARSTNNLIVRLDMYYLQSPEIMEQLTCYPIQSVWENENQQRQCYIVSLQYHPYTCTYDATFSQSSTNETIHTTCAIVTFTDTMQCDEIQFPDEMMHCYNAEYDTGMDVMKKEYQGVFFKTPIIYTGEQTTFFLTINGIVYKPCSCMDQVHSSCPIRSTYGSIYHIYNKEINISMNGTRHVLLYGLYVPRIISPLYKTIMKPFFSSHKEYLYHGHQKRHFLEYLNQVAPITTTTTLVHEELFHVMNYFSTEIVQLIHEYMGNEFCMYKV